MLNNLSLEKFTHNLKVIFQVHELRESRCMHTDFNMFLDITICVAQRVKSSPSSVGHFRAFIRAIFTVL